LKFFIFKAYELIGYVLSIVVSHGLTSFSAILDYVIFNWVW